MSGDTNGVFLPPDPHALSGTQEITSSTSEASLAGTTLIERHDILMALPGVVMLGETIDATGRPAILIGVKSARNLAKLPQSIDGIPVVTQVIGEVDAQ